MAERAQHPPTPPSTLEAKQAGIAGQLKRKPQIQAVIEGSLESIKAIFEMDVVEHEWGSGIATKLELTWSAIENLWPPAADKPDLALEIYRSTCEKLDEIVFIALSATLSPNINDLLPNLEIRQPLDLAFVYAREFPSDLKMRKRLIDELAQERGSIDGGVVDAENGIVYRIAPTAAGRRKSLWRVAGIFTLVGLETTLAFFAGPLFLTGWPVKKFGYATLLANYLFLFLGVIAHLLIDALKQKRVQVKPNFAAMDDWLI